MHVKLIIIKTPIEEPWFPLYDKEANHRDEKQDQWFSQFFNCLCTPAYIRVSKRKKHIKDSAASFLVACCCTCKNVSCLYEDDQPSGTGGKSDSIGDVRVYFSFSEILYWFVCEEVLLWTDSRNQTLQQTYFYNFFYFILLIIYCWIHEG